MCSAGGLVAGMPSGDMWLCGEHRLQPARAQPVKSGVKVIVHVCVLSCSSHVQLFVTLWTVTCPAPLSMGFSRQEY